MKFRVLLFIVIIFYISCDNGTSGSNPSEPVPSNLSTTMSTGILPNEDIPVSGKYLDYTEYAIFTGTSEKVIPTDVTSEELHLAVPALARSGTVRLYNASGNYGSFEISTAKASFNSFEYNTVSAGVVLRMDVQNSKLVETVVFRDSISVSCDTSVTPFVVVTVPEGAVSGTLQLVMYNGETVETGSLTIE